MHTIDIHAHWYPEERLKLQAPELALKEWERCAKLPGMRGLYVATSVNIADRVLPPWRERT